ncbi:hypothetical protein CXF92_18495 [Pseudomonas sp. Choline-3u-10]|nr:MULTISPECIES: hypothetical protein [Pseudomonadaceae]MBK3797546.1 hypothetical protein [Stutzerimonas stutzeri]MBK3876385.1 hypothetical protein [Stutzerimonas stutzeri]PKG90908.1 hypothetical protein CXF92_18495 [Pseudomonas sp. Choline-3u-10]
MHLPNGQTRPWAQPFDVIAARRGDSHLVQAPGVVPVVRSTEEQAVDVANGWQWKTSAILAGSENQLHGTPLNGWIYCAPDGSRWRIPVEEFGAPLLGESWAAIVNASRFGLVGGSPDNRPLTFDIDPQQPALTDIDDVWICLHAVTPDGSKAILMAYVREDIFRGDMGITVPSGLQLLPVGFYLVSLTGGAADLSMDFSVLYSQSQTLGTAGSVFPVTTISEQYNTAIQVGPWHAYYRDRIVAAWFVDGAPVPVTWTMEWEGEINSPSPTGADPATRTCSASSALTWTLKVGATTVDTITASASQDTFERKKIGEVDHYESTTVYTVEGETKTYSYAGEDASRGWNSVGPMLINSYGGDTPLRTLENAGWGMIAMDDFDRFWWCDIQRYSNNLLGIRVYRRDRLANTVSYEYRAAAHPDGVDAGTLVSPSSPSSPSTGHLRYGSYNPVTGEVARNQSTPVCYV